MTVSRERCLQIAAHLAAAAEQSRELAAEYDQNADVWRARADDAR